MEFLAKVETTFSIQGRGLVLVPEEPEGEFLVRVGVTLELRTPDGRTIRTQITGVELLKRSLGHGPCGLAFLVGRDIGKDEVPAGTEIWYRQEDPSDAPSAN